MPLLDLVRFPDTEPSETLSCMLAFGDTVALGSRGRPGTGKPSGCLTNNQLLKSMDACFLAMFLSLFGATCAIPSLAGSSDALVRTFTDIGGFGIRWRPTHRA
jgi:hypothetical protein